MREVVQVPVAIQHMSIAGTDLSSRTRNLLLRNRLRTVGALDGLSTADLLRIDQIGPGTVTEIVDFLRRLGAITATQEVVTDYKPTVSDVPSYLARVPTSSLALDKGALEALYQQGCHTLGDLSDCDLSGVLSPTRLAKLRELVDVLGTIPMEKLVEMSWETKQDDICVPALSAELLLSIASARTLDEEVQALCANLGARNRDLVLARLRYRSAEQFTFEELGERTGITRERVRQIVTRHLKKLAESGLRLPIGSRVVREIDLAGGIASATVLVERLSVGEVLRDDLSVSPLSVLSKVGLIPKISWDPETRVWIGVEGRSAWVETGQLSEALKRLKGKARAELRRVGAVKESALEELSPFSAGHAATLIAPRGSSLDRVLGYLVPKPSPDSSLVRQARKVLAVTAPLPIVQLHSGLLRNPRLDPVPPRDVVEFVLRQHSGFEVTAGRARLRGKPLQAEILSESEHALVELIEEHQGVILLQDMVDGMKRRGFSEPMASVLTRSPILTRVATAVYALRGRRVPNQLLSERRNEWLGSRSTNIITSGWEGPGRFIVTYRVSRFNLSGVFAFPSALSTQREEWRCSLPTGEVVPVTIRGNSFWGTYRQLRNAGVREGDYLVATFYPEQTLVEFDLV